VTVPAHFSHPGRAKAGLRPKRLKDCLAAFGSRRPKGAGGYPIPRPGKPILMVRVALLAKRGRRRRAGGDWSGENPLRMPRPFPPRHPAPCSQDGPAGTRVFEGGGPEALPGSRAGRLLRLLLRQGASGRPKRPGSPNRNIRRIRRIWGESFRRARGGGQRQKVKAVCGRNSLSRPLDWRHSPPTGAGALRPRISLNLKKLLPAAMPGRRSTGQQGFSKGGQGGPRACTGEGSRRASSCSAARRAA